MHVKNLPGAYDFLDLSDGRCHYRATGDPGAKPVLLLHGATVPTWEFDRLIPYLNEAGYRTLGIDLFGHGYSDRPRTLYNHELLLRQVREFLGARDEREPVSVIGHSLGAAVGARLAAAEPSRVRSIVLTAPLLDFASAQRGLKLLSMPGIGEFLMQAYVVPMLKRRRSRRYRDIEDGHFVTMFDDQFRIDGFGAALLSLIRSGALGDQSDSYRDLHASGQPVQILRGLDDKIFSGDQLDALARLLPRAEVHGCPGMGHPLMLTHPDVIAPLIIGFLDRNFELR